MSNKLRAYIHYHEYDNNFELPTLVIQGGVLSSGYELSTDGEVLKQVCICAAHKSTDCCCSYDWNEELEDWGQVMSIWEEWEAYEYCKNSKDSKYEVRLTRAQINVISTALKRYYKGNNNTDI